MKPIFNRAPLTPNTLAALPLGSIRPEGWLKDQLQTQADGMSGSLFEIWPDVGENCGWLGGDGDSWERAPYYLDGLIPLAWELGDERLKQLCTRFVEWIIASQREDGWFGPESNDDYWPLMIALKALKQYFEATGDRRVLVLMDRFFRYEYKNLSTHQMREWAVARGGENMNVAIWLYNITGQKYLIELCRRINAQTLDWANFFHTFPVTTAMSRSMKWSRLKEGCDDEEPLEGEKRPYFRSHYHYSHVVDVAMGLKTPGVVNLFKSGFKEHGGFTFGWQKLMKYHGVGNGMFTGDEHLNGSSPTQGTETCAVVEAMHSIETLIGLGDFGKELPDLLEKIAYNALPAAFNADMTAHQYDQQVNQISATKEPRPWYNNGDDSNIFGFSPNFGCCTANYHQGWPKFVASLWYATNDNGLSAVSYAPCSVTTRINDIPVRLKVSGDYPFKTQVRIEVSAKESVSFPLYLRIPAWVEQPTVYTPDGEIMQVRAGQTACLNRTWSTGDAITLDLATKPRIKRHWYHQSVTVEYGPLLMAYQPEEDWKKVSGEGRFCDWEVTTQDYWGYAVIADEPQKVVISDAPAQAFKKGDAPVTVMAKAQRVEWKKDGANCVSMPIMPLTLSNRPVTLELVPYGSTSLRIGQFPIAANRDK